MFVPVGRVRTMEKTCSKCGVVFPLTEEFWHRDRTHSTGFKSACRSCRTEQLRVRPGRRVAVKPVSLETQAKQWALTRLVENHEGEFRRLVATRLESLNAPKKWITIV